MSRYLDLYRAKKELFNPRHLHDWLPKVKVYDSQGAESYRMTIKADDPTNSKYRLMEFFTKSNISNLLLMLTDFHEHDIFRESDKLPPEIDFGIRIWVYTAPHFLELLDFLIYFIPLEEGLPFYLEGLKAIRAKLVSSKDEDDYYYAFHDF